MKDREVVYSVAFEKDENGFPYKRIPNHLMVWKKSLVAHIPFDEVNYGEDSSWAVKVQQAKVIRRPQTSKKILYHYYFNQKTTETQKF
jgi:hypothetical protein